MSKLVEKIKDTFGTFTPIHPLDDEKDLKIDYNMHNAVVKDLEEMEFDAPYWIPDFQWAKVVKVHDGDSIHVICRPKNGDGNIYKFPVRLSGIDTPELRGGTLAANIAKTKLTERILGKIVECQDIQKDKYGRVLCAVYHDGKNVSDWLIENRLGYAYYGGKKKSVFEKEVTI